MCDFMEKEPSFENSLSKRELLPFTATHEFSIHYQKQQKKFCHNL